MIKTLSKVDASPAELRELVKWSVALLGQVIQKEAGEKLYKQIDELRGQMVHLRDGDERATLQALDEAFKKLSPLTSKDRLIVARAYTLMLELINSCENAYRSHRLSHRKPRTISARKEQSKAIIYVLTSHPTEARSPESIAIFLSIQKLLIRALSGEPERNLSQALFHDIELAWRVSVMRAQAPHVRDEAEHIYSTLLEDETITSLLRASHEIVPVYIRTWVGGDKDGHPGVDEKVMHQSLSLSREHLIKFVRASMKRVRETLELISYQGRPLQTKLKAIDTSVSHLKVLKAADGARVGKLRQDLAALSQLYRKEIGAIHPDLLRLQQLLHVFPGLVVPLELRESSDVLMSSLQPPPRTPKKPTPKLAIDRMLALLARVSRGGDPRWYARGFIVSMTNSLAHLQMADKKIRKALGKARIPVIPLFEQVDSLVRAEEIVLGMIHDPKIGKDIKDHWHNTVEMMVGYSDSSKESGVLPSRLAIATAMNRLDKLCQKEKVQALFFQGSGGSVDRGGGPVQDQAAWWPHSALKNYKVTIQGEMVERSLSSPEITRGQIERIAESTEKALSIPVIAPHVPIVQEFANRISTEYKKMIQDRDFLRVVERATPYLDLNELKIGSRPTSRAAQLSVGGLRAIPWVLCWTQTRVLFQTWWGVGSAWKTADQTQRQSLREAFHQEPVFSSYVRALGFTLAKAELSVFKIYLRNSGLEKTLIERFESLFDQEFQNALGFLKFVTEEENPLWYQPWLGASIRLRTPMIHPLNLLQILAIKDRDFGLFRCTVTGIASGMLTTG